jgi:hypothetical protein
MPDFFDASEPFFNEIPGWEILIRTVLAILFGLVIAWVYRWTHGGRSLGPMFATLILLCVLIAMVSMVIGNSVAKAFSLVGALSIVRFRTVVEDTRDTAFVMFSVIVGMAMGAGSYAVPLIGVPLVSLVAGVVHRRSSLKDQIRTTRNQQRMELTVRVALGRDARSLLQSNLTPLFDEQTFVSSGTAKQGSALEIKYQVSLKGELDPVTVVTSIHQVDGVQSVELKSLFKE